MRNVSSGTHQHAPRSYVRGVATMHALCLGANAAFFKRAVDVFQVCHYSVCSSPAISWNRFWTLQAPCLTPAFEQWLQHLDPAGEHLRHLIPASDPEPAHGHIGSSHNQPLCAQRSPAQWSRARSHLFANKKIWSFCSKSVKIVWWSCQRHAKAMLRIPQVVATVGRSVVNPSQQPFGPSRYVAVR